MNKLIINTIVWAGVMAMVISCADPENPTPTTMAYGNWNVVEHSVNGQADGSGIFERFTLERDHSYVLLDNNGVLTVGTWEATPTNLVLTESVSAASDSTADSTVVAGGVLDFEIEFMSYSKMRLLQTIESPTVGTIEIRYLMNHEDADDY